MQNWNQWQLPAGAVTTPVAQSSLGYAATAATASTTADPMALMQSYMQYYNQSAPNGYTPEQWAAAQQQGWAQWQQWQQQYQQWQAQYGDKYQETMKQLSAAQSINLAANQAQPQPPLPKEDTARPPPLPPPATASTAHQQFNMPPPHQNDLPLFPSKESATTSALPSASVTNYLSSNQQPPPPLPAASQPQQLPPLPPEVENRRERPPGVGQAEKRDSNVSVIGDGGGGSGETTGSSSAKRLKLDQDDEELTEAEKTFDAQFKQWEEQFNKWKQQNANHPDKTQYKQYEAKWTSWREKLLERREQMRKKREQQRQAAAAKVAATAGEADKSKSAVSNDDKILSNILSNSENQHLINNLIGIGKTLGLTGKQQSVAATTGSSLAPPPPPPPESTNSGSQPGIVAQGAQQQALSQQSAIGSNVAAAAAAAPPLPLSSWPNQHQWENNQQYHPRIEIPSNYGMLPSVMHQHPAAPYAHSMMPSNFTQPPPNLPSNNNKGPLLNFSQPPPNYPPNNGNQERDRALQGAPRGPANAQDRPPNEEMMRFGGRHPNERGDFPRRVGEPPDHNFLAGHRDNIANPSGNEQDQFMRPGGDAVFGRPNESFNEVQQHQQQQQQQQRFRRGDRPFPGDFGNNTHGGPMNFHPEGRFGPPMNERFASGNRFGAPMGNDRFPPPGDRSFAPDHDRFGGPDRFGGGERFAGSEAEKFGRGPGKEHRFDRPDSERFGPNDNFERFPDPKDRFSLGSERFGPNMNEHFGPNDRFGRGNNPADCFDPKDPGDHRRDSFGGNSRVFGRNPAGFSPPQEMSPELRKLMEKRKAASDVFRPTFLSDSEKTSSVGSLSESFKKIAGDSPFRSSFDFPKARPGGPPPMTGGFPAVGGRSPPSFHPFAPDSAAAPFDHHPRGGGGHLFNSNEPPGPPPLIPGFRQGVFPDSFAKHADSANYSEEAMEKNMENPNLQAQPTDIRSQSPAKYHPGNTGAAVAVDSSNDSRIDNMLPSARNAEAMQPTNEADSSAIVEQLDDPVVEGDSSKQNDDNQEENQASANNSGSQQRQQNIEKQDNGCAKQENIESSTSDAGENIRPKKLESLPFMGENDPRPEDLNIEPPPELPNLGPIVNNPDSGPRDTAVPFNEAFDGKELPAGGAQFHDGGPQGMPDFSRMNTNFRFPGPPPLFNRRGPHAFPSERPPFLPQNHGDNMPGPNDGQFGPNTPGDAGRFSPRRSHDDPYAEPDHSESPGENARNPNSGPQFGSPPFGSPRGPIGKFGPRGFVDMPFAPRNPGPFGPRGSDMQFRPRIGPHDAHRFPGDGPQFGFLGPNNNNRFGRPNEAPFDKRPPPSFGFPDGRPNEGPPAFGPRGPNDSSMLGGPRGPPPDTFSQGRHSPQGFNENRFDSRDFNDGPFGPDFKDRPLAAKGPMGDPGYTRDYARRDGTYTRREQFSDDKRPFGSPVSRPDETFDRNAMSMGPRKDNFVEYTRRMPPPQDSFKKDSDDARTRGNEATDPDRQSKFHGPNLFTIRPPPSMLPAAGGTGHPDEFRAPRQFNYNHGETAGAGEKKVVEHTPSQVVDYGHTTRPAVVVEQHLPPPVQCIDYGHGDSRPVERHQDQQQSRTDFKNWVENEQSIKDYAEKMRICYENTRKENATEGAKSGGYDNYEKSGYEARRSASADYGKQQRMKEHQMDWQQQQKQVGSDRRSCGERDRKERSLYDPLREQRLFFERDSNASDQSQGDRNARKERLQETYDTCRRDSDKDDNRSKGSVVWQENSNKNIVDAKLPDTSVSDTKKNVVEPTAISKALELAKMPNCTMVDDLLCPPGRQNRPPKIAVILRGPPGSGKSFVAKLIKDKEVEQGGSAPRILSLDDYFLVEKEIETKDDNGKKVTIKEMVYEYEEAMEQSYITSLVKAFKKNITDGFFNFIILDCINEKISDYEEMWSFAKSKGFKVYVCEMEMDLQICLKRNIHNRTEDEINRIIDYFEPTPSYHLKLDVNSMLQEQAIEEVDMEDSQQETQEKSTMQNEDSQDSHEDTQDAIGVSKWEKMEAENKLDRLDGLAKKKNDGRPQTMEDFLQVPDYYNMEDTSGKKRVRWADLEERKEQEKMRAVGFVVGHTNWDRMMDPTKGGSALTRTKFFSSL